MTELGRLIKAKALQYITGKPWRQGLCATSGLLFWYVTLEGHVIHVYVMSTLNITILKSNLFIYVDITQHACHHVYEIYVGRGFLL